jgi:hypothetical protein
MTNYCGKCKELKNTLDTETLIPSYFCNKYMVSLFSDNGARGFSFVEKNEKCISDSEN